MNTHRSALNLLINLQPNEQEIIKRLLKGVFRSRPSFPRYNDTWNPDPVIKYYSSLYPHSNLDFKKLTLKLIVLFALVTAQRAQTLSKIKYSDISINENKIVISLSDIIKTSSPNKPQPIITIPFFKDKPELCVANIILDYLKLTAPFRKDIPYLFLTTKKPYKGTSSQTISRWIKEGLKLAGIDTNKFRPHSTRHASTSAAYRAGLSVHCIAQAAGWSSKSQMFAKFYNRPLENKNSSLAHYVLDQL